MQQHPHRGRTPASLAAGSRHSLLVQPAADLRQRQPLGRHPAKDLTHHAGLLGNDLVARHPAAVVLTDVAIAVRGAGQHAHPAGAGRVQLAAAAAFAYLSSLILGNDALDLQQQVVLRASPQPAVEEDHLDAGAAELLDKYGLVGEIPRQAVRRVDVKAVDRAAGRLVAQALKGGPQQGGAAAAVVDETELLGHGATVVGGALAESGELAVDAALLGGTPGGHASVQGGMEVKWQNHV